MCNPVMMATTALSIVTQAVGVRGRNKAIRQGAINANEKARFDYSMLERQAKDVQDATAQESLQRQLQTARQRGQIAVAQGAAGVGGNSSLMVMNNAIMQERMDMDVIETNSEGRLRKIGDTMRSIHMGNVFTAQNARNAMPGASTQLLNLGMTGLSAGITGYRFGKSLKKIQE